MTKVTEKQLERKIRRGEIELDYRAGQLVHLFNCATRKFFTARVVG